MFFLSKKTKKHSVLAIIIIVVTVNVFSFNLFRPTPVRAQFVDVNQGLRNVTDNIGDSLLAAGLGALVNGASYFMRKIAYDTAKYIASGGKGQGALAFQDGFGNYLGNVAADSAFDAIDELGKPFGLNICQAPDVRLQIGLQVSISNIFENELDVQGGPQPSCTYNQFKENWDNARDSVMGDRNLLENFNTSLKTSQGDLGLALGILGKVDSIVAKSELGAQLERLEGGGFKPVSSLISGDIKTPAQITREEATGQLTATAQTKSSAEQIAGLYGADALSIFPMALSVFANTLASSLLQNVLERGLFPTKGDPSSVTDFYASTVNRNRQVAETAFSYLIAGIPQRPLTAYDVVTEYSTCGNNPGLNNCVMDSGLVQALERARVSAPLTIGEAILPQNNLLHEDWLLISDHLEGIDPNVSKTNLTNTNLQYCHSSAYCISNVEKLRKARILPLGFEIAVMKSPPDNPWKLGDVVNGFNECDPSGKPSDAFPYCKLIDPNWILKAPEARCEARVSGPELLTESTATRREECVDFSTCLETDENGQCKGFGYCTKEENVWNMPGQSCAPQFNTCKTYVAVENGTIASYLSRTLDVESCSADSIGCRAYSMDKVGDAWIPSVSADPSVAFSGRTQAIHFTNTAQCPASAEGCSLFMDPTISDSSSNEAQVYLKKAPEYLQCYDTDLTTPGIVEWPQTEAEIVKLNSQKAAACGGFAGACTGEEVGCEVYSPKNGGTTVTGIIGGNSCPTQCVGYETFKQEATLFESAKFPLNFIASNARTCSVLQVGCDEFTNINVASEGGEALEYYTSLKRCERPSGDNSAVFYSWEGSESQGYQLRRNTLLPITQSDATYISGLQLNYKSGDSVESVFPVGSPAYVEDVKTIMQSNYDQCNQESYNLLLNNVLNDSRVADDDCRALYNSNGEIFYRVFRNTVTVSNACTPLRKTDSELIADTNITAQNGGASLCESKGGLWEGGVCKRCASGGQYEINNEGIGSCMYRSIKAEAISCPAVANGCRSYIGNTGNNLHIIDTFGFEPSGTSVDALNAAKQGWSGNTSVQAEALQVGLHSLRVNGPSTDYTFAAGKLQAGAWYELRFWARGNAPFGLTVGFSQAGQAIGNTFTFDPSLNNNRPASVGVQWQEYRVGPVQFVGDNTNPVQLYFTGQVNGGSQFYFLDNIEFIQIGSASSNDDHVFLVKNSWRTPEGNEVPLACDSTQVNGPLPDNGLPGEYLGCREYTNNGSTFALTGFDRLCRDEAVGCRALVDTQNTVTGVRPEEKQGYGVVCRKATTVNTQTPCSVTLTESSSVSATYTCTVAKGERECRVQTAVVIPDSATDAAVTFLNGEPTLGRCISLNGSCAVNNNDKLVIDESTVVVKEDSGLIYLAAQDKFVCQEDNLACTRVGLETKNVNANTPNAYSYADAFIINNPTTYDKILCSGDEVGCAAFKNDNSLVYFKDPEVSGDTQCVYKDKVTLGEGLAARTYSGWFKDTGKCAVSNQECRADTDCGGNDRCVDIGVVPCYENYLDSGNEYSIWSQGSIPYEGNVGVCDTNNNGCTELIDRAAITSSTPNGKSYYALMNDRLKENIGQCEGKVSQKEGCVLFDVTENPDKIFDTSASYDASRAATPIDSLVNPVRSQNTNDANFILKVERDRQCSEWLACGSSITVTDENGNEQVLCQQYIACNKFNSTGECIQPVNTSRDNSQMTEEKYIARSTGWTAPEYSGYSFFNTYNPGNFVYLLFEGKTEAYMGYEMSHAFFAAEDVGAGCRATVTSGGSTSYVKADGAVCGFDAGGRCYRQRCIYPIEGTFDFTPAPGNDLATSQANVERMLIEMQPGICKSYPESTSPFSVEVAVKNIDEEVDMKRNENFTRFDFTEKKELYERANVCQSGSDSTDCSCEYLKVEYKNGVVDYWATKDSKLVAPGICTGGDNDGNPCTTANECGSGSMCSAVKQKGTFIGQRGLCIEYDLSRPLGTSKETARLHEAFACLTWLPIQVSASSMDLNNMDPEAGYYPVSNYDSPLGGGHAYCTESTNRGAGYYNPILAAPEFSPAGSTINGLQMRLYVDDGPVFYDAWSGSGSGGNGVFDSNDQTNYGIDRGTGIYAELMSNTDTSGTKLKVYRSMQAWAWENIGPSSRILRLDTKGGDRIYYYSEVGDKTNVYGFATLTNVGESIPNDSGTLMHPPRLFENQGTSLEIGGYYMNPGKGHFFPMVGTAALSPEIGFSGGEELAKFIETDAQVESSLKEEDLESIHFVPISFPDGAEGYNPALLTPNVSIDFAALRRVAPGPARAYREDVYAYTDAPSGPGCSGQARYRVCDSNNRMVGLSYLLERGTTGVNGDGLLSFEDYAQSREGDYYSSYIESSADVRQRSEIYHRYVSFIFSPDEVAFQSLKTGDARIPDINSDPFTAECKFPGGNQNRNWLAIGMDFNKDGEFLGYITRWCMNTNNTDGEANGIRFATIAKMQDRCLEYSAVVDNEVSLVEDNNKAWTDRVWINSTYQPGLNSLLAIIKAEKTGLAPYGSLPQSIASAEILRANLTKPVPYYGFPDYDFGVQYQCSGGDGFANGAPSIFGSKNCARPAGESESITNITNAITRDPKEGQDKLRELFMKYYAMKNFVNIGSLPNTAIADADKDKSGDVDEIGNATRPPQIFSINPYTCSQRGGNCTAAEADAFSINFRNFTSTDYNNDGSPDEDSNQQDGVDPIVAEGTYYAIANFFAYADDNRMPIKSVKVEWGDNSFENSSPDGLYKNRKPYCGATDDFTYSYNATTNNGLGRCVGTQITCNTSEDCKYAGANGSAVACESPAIPTPSRVGVCRYTPSGPATVPQPGVVCQSDAECQPYDPANYTTQCILPNQGGSDHSGGQCLSTRRQNSEFTNNVSCQQTSNCPVISGSIAVCDLPPLATPPTGQRHFGDAPRACRTQYFEYSHTYQCTSADTNAKVSDLQTTDFEAYKRLIGRAGVTPETDICVFRPKVQVMDNWGWCNASRIVTSENGGPVLCPNDTTGKGCYEGDDQLCTKSINAYTQYKGKIILLPTSE